MAIANPDIIFLGGLGQYTETAADIQLETSIPPPAKVEDPMKYLGIGAIVGFALGAVATYMTVKKR